MNSPKQIAEFFSGLGVTKAETPLRKMLLLSVLAGIFIALAGVGATIAGAVVNKFAGACVFPAGLAMVVIAGSELFTGDNLMIVSLLDKMITLGKMLLVLLVVYAGNFIGGSLRDNFSARLTRAASEVYDIICLANRLFVMFDND